MVEFLKLLYPISMFERESSINNKGRFAILELADKYQCVNLIKICLNEVNITADNVLEVLPYALKYDVSLLDEIYDVINWGVPTDKLKGVLPEIENHNTSKTMLLNKCRFLESTIIEMQQAMIHLVSDFLNAKRKETSVVLTSGKWSCPHTIKVEKIGLTKRCQNCENFYKDKFLDQIVSSQTSRKLFSILQKGQNITDEVKKYKCS